MKNSQSNNPYHKSPEKLTQTERIKKLQKIKNLSIKIKNLIAEKMHPNNIKTKTVATTRNGINFSKREAKESVKMMKIYILSLANKKEITDEDLKSAHHQLSDLLKFILLVPAFLAPFGSVIIVALEKLANKMDKSILPKESF